MGKDLLWASPVLSSLYQLTSHPTIHQTGQSRANMALASGTTGREPPHPSPASSPWRSWQQGYETGLLSWLAIPSPSFVWRGIWISWTQSAVRVTLRMMTKTPCPISMEQLRVSCVLCKEQWTVLWEWRLCVNMQRNSSTNKGVTATEMHSH